MSWRTGSLIGIVVGAVLLAGCGPGEPAADSTSPAATPAVRPSPARSSVTGPPPATTRKPALPAPAVPQPPVLGNGRYAVWLTGLDQRSGTVTFDVVQWLTGAAADAAFHREHPDAPDRHVPNGYYIVNQNPRLRTLPVRPGVSLSVLVPMHGAEQQRISFATFPDYLAGDLEPHDNKLWYNPFWLTIHNDRVDSVAEQYIP